MYCVAVVGCLQLSAYRAFERGGECPEYRQRIASSMKLGDFPTMQKTMQEFTSPLMTIGYLTALALLSIIPAPRWFLLGNEGEPLFAWIAPAMWIFATGLIATSIYVLDALKFIARPIHRLLGGGVQRCVRSACTARRVLTLTLSQTTKVDHKAAYCLYFWNLNSRLDTGPIPSRVPCNILPPHRIRFDPKSTASSIEFLRTTQRSLPFTCQNNSIAFAFNLAIFGYLKNASRCDPGCSR